MARGLELIYRSNGGDNCNIKKARDVLFEKGHNFYHYPYYEAIYLFKKRGDSTLIGTIVVYIGSSVQSKNFLIDKYQRIVHEGNFNEIWWQRNDAANFDIQADILTIKEVGCKANFKGLPNTWS